MEFGQIVSLISLGISFLSVLTAFYAVRESRKAVFSGAYFSEMTAAYAGFLESISNFAYQRGIPERDALAPALYKLLLYAPKSIGDEAQELYLFVLRWAQSGQPGALPVDERVNRLGDMMRKDIISARGKGCFKTGTLSWQNRRQQRSQRSRN